MTDHTEYRPLRLRHQEALIRQELKRLAAAGGGLHPATSVSVATPAARSRPASAAALERVSVPHGRAGVLSGPS
jgi:hypothetical protein